jgi:uncharacterized ion transporter superfamily protein YfcC
MPFSLQRFNFPHVFIFLSGIILFCSILTYVVPSGEFQRTKRQLGSTEQTVVVPGSYQQLPKHFSLRAFFLGEKVDGKASPTSLLGLFTAIPKGLNQSAALIFFVFTIGAVFNLIRHTGTVHVIIFGMMRRFRNRPKLLLFGIYMIILALSTFLGSGSEFMPLIPLFLIIAKEYGYDRIFGLALLMLPFALGWTVALTNPFTVQIAQTVAEVPIGSGFGLRLILLVAIGGFGFLYLMSYGKRVQLDPGRSYMKEDPFILSEHVDRAELSLKKKHVLIVLVAAMLFAFILYAVQKLGWGLIEMTGGFFIVGLATILISGMSGTESMNAFVKGLEIMIIPALVIGFARGIQVVMLEGQILDTILNATAKGLEQLPKILAAEGMFIFQSFLNFFIPSASGQALVSMPLMVPLADLLGLTRQTSVLAYTLGDGLSNLIVPTSGILMAMLGLAGIPYEKWVKFILPLFLATTAIGFAAMAFAVLIAY